MVNIYGQFLDMAYRFILNFICLLSFSISLYGCIKYLAGAPVVNEDITKVLELCPETVGAWIFVFFMLILFELVQVVMSKPIQRCHVAI